MSIDIIVQWVLTTSPIIIYGIVTLFLLLESSAVPVANNTVLLLTGALASAGHLNIWVLGVAAILGSITGACLAYKIGERGGHQVLLKLASLLRIDPQKILLAERWYQKSGLWMVFLSRMTPYVRPFACLPAGIARMPFTRFFIAALSGSIIWCIVLLGMGWYLGQRWELAVYLMQNYMVPTLIGLILLIGFFLFGRHKLTKWLRGRHSQVSAKKLGDTKDTHDLQQV